VIPNGKRFKNGSLQIQPRAGREKLLYEFPPWATVYGYFRRYTRSGVLKKVHAQLVEQARLTAGRAAVPCVLLIDSQSVRAHWGEQRGYDGFKKVRGRKRHFLVDTLGLIHDLRILPANRPDDLPAVEMMNPQTHPQWQIRPIRDVFVDGSYRGRFERAIHEWYGFWPSLKATVQIRRGVAAQSAKLRLKESNLTPKRWIVERTFAWLNHYRRLSRDYERLILHSEAMIHLSMTLMLIKRAAQPSGSAHHWV
jgi:putative transposase